MAAVWPPSGRADYRRPPAAVRSRLPLRTARGIIRHASTLARKSVTRPPTSHAGVCVTDHQKFKVASTTITRVPATAPSTSWIARTRGPSVRYLAVAAAAAAL